MKRIALILLFALPVFCQSDILVSVHSPYFDLGRSLKFGQSGVGGVNNNFIFNPYAPQTGTCIWFYNNNPTNTHNVGINVLTSADPNVTSFIGNQGKWAGILAYGQAGVVYTSAINLNIGAMNPAITGSGIQVLYIPSRGAARVALQFTGSIPAAGSPDTMDVFGAFTDQSTCATNVNGPAGLPTTVEASNVFGFVTPINGQPTNAALGVGPNNGGWEGMQVAPMAGSAAATLAQQPVNTSNWNGPALTEKGARWVLQASGVGVIATATRAAGAVGVVHVIDCVSFSAISNAALVASAQNLQILDGVSQLWLLQVAFPTAAGAAIQVMPPFSVCGLNLAGTAATSMTVGFSSGNANAVETISASGYDVQ